MRQQDRYLTNDHWIKQGYNTLGLGARPCGPSNSHHAFCLAEAMNELLNGEGDRRIRFDLPLRWSTNALDHALRYR